MTNKSYQVRFATVTVGRRQEDITPLSPRLDRAFERHGSKLPEVVIDGDNYQIRDLVLIGDVWQGVFARLKDDAPHKVDAESNEHEISLDEGDRILEKCFFTYRRRRNLLTWQNNRSVATLSKLQLYLCQVLEDFASVNQCMNEAELEEILSRDLYEIQFSYARLPQTNGNGPRWAQADFDRMRDLHAATGKFLFRAERGSSLGRRASQFVRQALTLQSVEKLRIRLTDDTNPIDLFLAPVKDKITVPLVGRYPDERAMYEALEVAFDRNSELLPN
ncbi:MAG: DUF6731 family protein [Aquabacterium sp.]